MPVFGATPGATSTPGVSNAPASGAVTTQATSQNQPLSQPTQPVVATSPSPAPTAKQVDFFAEQNARDAKKKAKNAKTIKLFSILGGIILILVIASVVVWFTLLRGEQSDSLTMDEINNLRFTFSDIYNETKSLDDVRSRYNKILDTELGRENADQVKLQLMFFYMSNGFAARTVEVGESVDIAKLSSESQSAYYNQMYNAYLNTGATTKAEEAQYESAMLIGDRLSGSDDTSSDDTEDEPSDIPTPGEDAKVYVCDGVEYSFPVECAVNGEEPNVF